MKSYKTLLGGVVAFALLCPSLGKGLLPSKRAQKAVSVPAAFSNQDKEIMRMRAYKTVAAEMGEDADEVEMLARVEELTDKLLRESFPEAFAPKPKKKRYADSDDIWENGTVVRYLARGMFAVLVMAGLYAWNDNQVTPRALGKAKSRSAPRSESDVQKKTR